MLPLLLASLLSAGRFETGGRIGVLFPASGLENTHAVAALLGVSLGYEVGSDRFTVGYDYSGLQAKQTSSYRFDIHRLSVGYGREFALGRAAIGSTSSWGGEASASAGCGLLIRTLGSAREAGKAPAGALGAGFYQRQGRARLSLGFDNVFFVESRPASNSRIVSLTYLMALKGGVTYVF